MKKIILASTSPRRKDLLEKLGIKFKVVPSSYKEDMSLKLSPASLVKFLALGKAKAVAKKYPDALVIGADTIVYHKGRVLGKPHTPEKARIMLKSLSGR